MPKKAPKGQNNKATPKSTYRVASKEINAVMAMLPVPSIDEMIASLESTIAGWDGIDNPDNCELWELKELKCHVVLIGMLEDMKIERLRAA